MAEADPCRVAAELARGFPGVSVWHGESTGMWWAPAHDRAGRDRLVEAPPGEGAPCRDEFRQGRESALVTVA